MFIGGNYIGFTGAIGITGVGASGATGVTGAGLQGAVQFDPAQAPGYPAGQVVLYEGNTYLANVASLTGIPGQSTDYTLFLAGGATGETGTTGATFLLNAGKVIYEADGLTLGIDLGGADNRIVWSVYRLT